MAAVRWWGLFSAAATPVALIGGWLVAAALQPAGYDPVHQTISALAAHGATDSWVMTSALYAVGLGNVLTAAALVGLRSRSRVFLAAGGLAGIGVAVFPQPHAGSSPLHIGCAAVSILILAIWPATVRTSEPGTAIAGEPATSILLGKRFLATVTGSLVALDIWLFAAGQGIGQLGVAERVATGAENMWPLAVVLTLRHQAARMHQ
jgi:hypothetical membrane protein